MILYRNCLLQLVVFSLLITSIISCSRRTPNDLYVVRVLKESLEKNTAELEKENELILTSFQLKAKAPETKQKAELLLPKMLQVKSITSSVINDIKKAQIDLREEAAYKDDSKTSYYDDNLDVVKRIFMEKGRAAQLFRKVKSYKNQLEEISLNDADFVRNQLADIPVNETVVKDLENFLEFFKHQPAIAVDAFLESLKADLLFNEKRMLFYISQSMTHHLVHYFPEVLVGTNMRYFKPGDKLQLIAGIAEFRYFSKSYMMVNGKKILPNEKGMFVYETNIVNGPGSYQIPVEVNYVEADGNQQTLNKSIEYSVIK